MQTRKRGRKRIEGGGGIHETFLLAARLARDAKIARDKRRKIAPTNDASAATAPLVGQLADTGANRKNFTQKLKSGFSKVGNAFKGFRPKSPAAANVTDPLDSSVAVGNAQPLDSSVVVGNAQPLDSSVVVGNDEVVDVGNAQIVSKPFKPDNLLVPMVVNLEFGYVLLGSQKIYINDLKIENGKVNDNMIQSYYDEYIRKSNIQLGDDNESIKERIRNIVKDEFIDVIEYAAHQPHNGIKMVDNIIQVINEGIEILGTDNDFIKILFICINAGIGEVQKLEQISRYIEDVRKQKTGNISSQQSTAAEQEQERLKAEQSQQQEQPAAIVGAVQEQKEVDALEQKMLGTNADLTRTPEELAVESSQRTELEKLNDQKLANDGVLPATIATDISGVNSTNQEATPLSRPGLADVASSAKSTRKAVNAFKKNIQNPMASDTNQVPLDGSPPTDRILDEGEEFEANASKKFEKEKDQDFEGGARSKKTRKRRVKRSKRKTVHYLRKRR